MAMSAGIAKLRIQSRACGMVSVGSGAGATVYVSGGVAGCVGAAEVGVGGAWGGTVVAGGSGSVGVEG